MVTSHQPKVRTKIRIITDCSQPQPNSINNAIPPQPFRYESIDRVVKLLKVQSDMAVLDISEAYRAVPLHPSEWQYFGMKWKGQYFVDTQLPFGVRSAPAIFTRIGRAIKLMMKRRGFPDIVIYLDDFLIVESSAELCQECLDTLIQLLQSLGFTPNAKKLQGPSKRVIFLPVEIDSNLMQLRLSNEKIKETLSLIKFYQSRRKLSLKELPSASWKTQLDLPSSIWRSNISPPSH